MNPNPILAVASKAHKKPTTRRGWKRLENALVKNSPNRRKAKAQVYCAQLGLVTTIKIGKQRWNLK